MRQIYYLILVAILWSTPSVFIKYLSFHFDIITQSFFRYLAASIFLWVIILIFMKGEAKRAFIHVKAFLLMGILLAGFQILMVWGIYLTTAVTHSLMARLNIIFIAVWSYFLFADERQIIRSKNFIFGALIAFISLTGFILGKGGTAGFNIGALVLLSSVIIWSTYSVLIKKVVKNLNPLIPLTYVLSSSTIIFLPITLLFGNITTLAERSLFVDSVLFGSGIIAVGLGGLCYYNGIKYFGTSITTSFLLLAPILTAFWSYFILDEVLKPVQVIFGLMVLTGVYIIVRKFNNRLPVD